LDFPVGSLLAPKVIVRYAVALILVAALAAAGCGQGRQQHQVTDALERAGSWADTVKVVTEQWAQSRVSQRFTRTTLVTATTRLDRDAESIRGADPAAAARIDRLKAALDPVMAAVALNEPDRALEAATGLIAIVGPAGK